MSTRKEMIRKASILPNGSPERRTLLRRLKHAAPQKRDEFQIVDAFLRVSTTFDTLEEGAVGGPNDGEWHIKLGSHKDFKSLVNAVMRHLGTYSKLEWEVVEPGRVEASYTSDAEGNEQSKREVDAFLAGNGEAYICDVSIYFRFARVWTPSENEIDKTFRL